MATPSLQSTPDQGHRDGSKRPKDGPPARHARNRSMDGDHARFRNMVDLNGGLLPWMETRCWEWTGARDKSGRPKFWLGDNQGQFRDNSVTAQRAALILAGRALQPGEYVGAACGNRGCVRPGHLVIGTLKECRALRGRGPCPLGPGGVWLIRDVVRSGEGTAEQLAEVYGTSPEFIATVAGTR